MCPQLTAFDKLHGDYTVVQSVPAGPRAVLVQLQQLSLMSAAALWQRGHQQDCVLYGCHHTSRDAKSVCQVMVQGRMQ